MEANRASTATTSTSIKGYELREVINSGGQGAVYTAYQSSVGREVAIKIILPQFANRPDFIRRFETEAQLIARLEHLHIIPLYDYWRDPDGAYLVMRFLKGGSLKDALHKEGAFDLESTALLLDQICAALGVAHRNGVIHRDLKPGNILLDEDGNAYLADFGIAKDLAKIDGHTDPASLLGTFDYIAPEQVRSEPVTPQNDLYSLGVILYEVLTGQHPFPDVKGINRMFKHLDEPLPFIKNLPKDAGAAVIEGINTIIQKATAKNPALRYTDALEIAAVFRQEAGLQYTPSGLKNLVEMLSWREQEILQRIVEGKSNKEISQDLFIEVTTVRWYIRQIYKKLHVRSRMQAIVRARELNLIVSGDTPATSSVSGTKTATFIALPEPENPYKGLLAFQSADARDFFGREKLTQKLIARLSEETESARFLAVIGPSGSGKSSLVKAGLIPALVPHNRTPGALPGSERWFVVEMMPGTRPIDELEIALTKVAANHSTNLNGHLQRDAYGLVRIAQLILPNDDSQLLLVIDQFEEVFTLVEDEDRRVHFLDLIHAAVTDPRSRVKIVATLRADFYDRPLHYPKFGDLIRNRMETVLPLSAEELERAILEPAKQVNVAFESGLVTKIVGEVNYQPGALPLLQYALTELFEHRQDRLLTHEAYQQIGRTVGALARRAEDIFISLDEAGQEAVRQLFLRLVTLGEGTEDTRRRVERAELMAIAHDEDLMDDIINTYADYRLFSLDHDPTTRTPTVEVAHEAILREWERLRTWLNESREDVRLQRQLAMATAEWHKANRDSSYLVRGSRLEQFEKWAADTKLALTADEHTFLESSLNERERQNKFEAERQAKERLLEKRSVQRLRAAVAILLIASFFGILLTLAVFNQGRATAQERDRAESSRDKAEREAELSQSIALSAKAQEALLNNNTDLAIVLALEANAIEDPPIQARQALSDTVFAPGTRRVLTGHQGPVSSVAFSPDGRYAVSAPGRLLSYEISRASDYYTQPITDFALRLWDLQTGQEIRRFEGHTDAVWAVTFSPDGSMILSASEDKTLILWDAATATVIRRFVGHRDAVRDVVFSPDGQTALSGSDDNSMILWDIATGTPIRQLTSSLISTNMWKVAISPDGRYALSANPAPGSVITTSYMILWELATGEELYDFRMAGQVRSVAFSPNGRYALAATQEPAPNTFGLTPEYSVMVLWDLEARSEVRRFVHRCNQITDVAFSPDGRTAVSASGDLFAVLWDLESGRVLNVFNGHSGWLTDLDFSPDGRQLLSSSDDHTIRLWDIHNGAEERRFEGHLSVVQGVDFSPDSRLAASASADRTIIVWDVTTGQIIRQIRGHDAGLRSVDFTPDGQQLVSSSFDSTIRVWDVATGAELQRLINSQPIQWSALSPQGRYVVTAEGTGGSRPESSLLLRLWDLEAGQQVRTFAGHFDRLWRVSVSPDGRYASSPSGDSTVRVWDLATGAELHRFEAHIGAVYGSTFTSDGRSILSFGEDRVPLLQDIQTGQILQRFEGHQLEVYQMVLSNDDQFALSAGADQKVILWEVATGTPIRRFTGHARRPFSVAISPDGQYGLSGGQGGEVILWRLHDTPEQIIAWAYANRYVRELSCSERLIYEMEPYCDRDASVPSPTPYPTLTPSLIPSPTPTVDLTHTTATPTRTPFPLPTATITPTPAAIAPIPKGELGFGTASSGSLSSFGRSAGPHAWIFTGTAGQAVMLTYTTPGAYFEIYDVDGTLLFDRDVLNPTTSPIGPLVLPATGIYTLVIGLEPSVEGGFYSVTLTEATTQ